MVPTAIDKLVEGADFIKNTIKAKKDAKEGTSISPVDNALSDLSEE